VNSVGTNLRNRALDVLTNEDWRTLIGTNLDPAFTLTRSALPTFRSQHDGLFVHISSLAARHPDRSGVGYQAAKAGLIAFAHATMLEERENGVRVSVILPGFTATPLVQQRPIPPTPEELEHALQPEDVARMIVAVLALPGRAYVPELHVGPIAS
jgi:NAD(P)-dependent dehydrogenase (short-subunit alcohol dehydrogenase family)